MRLPFGMRSSAEMRTRMGMSSPQVLWISSTISHRKRARFSALPPYSSVRWLEYLDRKRITM